MENELLINGEAVPLPEDDADQLMEKYETSRREGRADDAAAMQAAVCIVIAIGCFVLNIFRPETAGALLEKLRELACAPGDILNPIDWVISHWPV